MKTPSDKYEFLNKNNDIFINIFDFDETIVTTDSRIKVYNRKTKEKYFLTSQEFNNINIEDSDLKFDFSEFDDPDKLKAGKLIYRIFNILKHTINNHRAVGIITARDDKNLIRNFLLNHNVDVNPDFIFAVGGRNKEFSGPVPNRKKDAFKRFIDIGFRRFRFYDDSLKNLELVKELENEIQGIKIETEHVDIS